MAYLLRRYKSPLLGNYQKYVLLYGVVAGCVLFVGLVGAWLVDLPLNAPESYVTEVLLALCIFCCSYIYRQNETGGRIYLKELLILGIGMGVVSGVVYGVLILFYGSVIDLDFVGRCIETRVSQMDVDSAEDPAQMLKAIEETRKYTLGDWAFIGGFRNAVMSIIIAFFSAIIFRTEKSGRV